MTDNLNAIPFSSDDENRSFPEVAQQVVQEVLYDDDANVYVVWFAYTLGNWKALCSTDIPDGRYYEVTYNKDKGVAYLDTYVKIGNLEVEL